MSTAKTEVIEPNVTEKELGGIMTETFTRTAMYCLSACGMVTSENPNKREIVKDKFQKMLAECSGAGISTEIFVSVIGTNLAMLLEIFAKKHVGVGLRDVIPEMTRQMGKKAEDKNE